MKANELLVIYHLTHLQVMETMRIERLPRWKGSLCHMAPLPSHSDAFMSQTPAERGQKRQRRSLTPFYPKGGPQASHTREDPGNQDENNDKNSRPTKRQRVTHDDAVSVAPSRTLDFEDIRCSASSETPDFEKIDSSASSETLDFERHDSSTAYEPTRSSSGHPIAIVDQLFDSDIAAPSPEAVESVMKSIETDDDCEEYSELLSFLPLTRSVLPPEFIPSFYLSESY